MPSLAAGEIERLLVGKLCDVERQGGDHRLFVVYDADGRSITRVPFSRSWRGSMALGPAMVGAIRRQLGVQAHADAFVQLVRCTMSREQYLALVGSEH
jgi:hypothetical protein